MRSYDQHCALAKGLDVVGDRWSLLIVRELMTGQERWSEIRDGLPGVAKNLLADRLRSLEDQGVIAHEGDRYTLTERGWALGPVLHALVLWGAPAIEADAEDEEFRPRWLELVARSHPDLELVELDDDHAVVTAAGVEVSGSPREVVDQLAALVRSGAADRGGEGAARV